MRQGPRSFVIGTGDDDGHRLAQPVHGGEQFGAVTVRHVQIRDDEIELLGGKLAERVTAIPGTRKIARLEENCATLPPPAGERYPEEGMKGLNA